MSNSNALLAHIQALNAKTKVWLAEDPSKRFATLIVDDLQFWAAEGITTVEQFEISSLKSQIWDLYKDVNGVRPRWINFDEMTHDELDQMVNQLVEQSRQQYQAELARDKEQLELEARLCERFNVDTVTLVKWGVLEPTTPWRSGREWVELEYQLADRQFDL